MKLSLRTAIFGLMCLGTAAYPCFMYAPMPVHVSNDTIEVTIRDQVAVKIYHCSFKNPNPRAVVGGTCYMEVEPGAQVDDLSIQVDGVETKAELLDVDKARKVFTDIVRNGGSPALLEFYGKQLIRTEVPQIPPGGKVVVKLQYTTIVEKKGNLVRLSMLNTNPKALMQPLEEASVTVKISSKTPINNVYSPTHDIKLVEDPKADIKVVWSQKNYLPKKPFVLYYATSDSAMGMNVLAHRQPHDEAGTFMLMMSPSIGADLPAMAKDIVFCVDTSGSMVQGGKIQQAREALRHCLQQLRPADRFAIVNFGTEVKVYESGLQEASEVNVRRAVRFAEALAAKGGTAIEEGLGKSLGLFDDSARLKMVLFATDGLPTIGESDTDKLAAGVAKANTRGVRIFSFGEGHDVNTRLLDLIAHDNRGDSDYIMPEEAISEKIGAFFDRVGTPVLADLSVKVDGADVEDVYPRTLPDLFKGGQVMVMGRYTIGGAKRVTITGKVDGVEKSFTHVFEFPELSPEHEFLPRLWAGRKVTFYLDQMRRHGENKELIDEVVVLAKRYGILTPYTSFLMAEDAIKIPPRAGGGVVTGGRRLLEGKLADEQSKGYGAAPAARPEDRRDFAREAERLGRLRKASNGAELDAAIDGEYRAHGGQGSSWTQVRTVVDRAFYQSGGVWYDALYDEEKEKDAGEKIKVGSDAYFKLLADEPAVAPFLAQINVVFKFKGKLYRVSEK